MKLRIYLLTGLAVITFCSLLFMHRASAEATTNKPARIYTKIPWAVGFDMKGTVTNVTALNERIQFQFVGWFRFTQYPWGGTNQEIVKVNCEKGVSATVTPESFVAMTSDWRAGSESEKGKLLKILKTAAERGTEVKIALTQPKVDFGINGFSLLDAKVWRITDIDLR